MQYLDCAQMQPYMVCMSQAQIVLLLRKLIAEHGLAAAARILGVSRSVLSSAVAELSVRQGSWALIRERLGAYVASHPSIQPPPAGHCAV